MHRAHRRRTRFVAWPALFLAWAALPSAAGAQAADSLRAALPLTVPQYPPALPRPAALRSSPAMGDASPSGFGATWGDVYVGASYQSRARYSRNRDGRYYDGTVGAGFGLGNPWTHLGVQVDVSSFTTMRNGFGTRMAADLKVHRMLPGLVGVAVGYESFLLRGSTDSGRNLYVAASKWMPMRDPSEPFSEISLTVGVGDGRFQREADFRAGARMVNAFGSVGVRVLEPVSLLADWTGQDLVLGASIAPFARRGLVITPALADVIGTAGDGARFVVSAGYGVRLVR